MLSARRVVFTSAVARESPKLDELVELLLITNVFDGFIQLKALYRLLLVRRLLFPEDEELSYEFVRPLVAPKLLELCIAR